MTRGSTDKGKRPNKPRAGLPGANPPISKPAGGRTAAREVVPVKGGRYPIAALDPIDVFDKMVRARKVDDKAILLYKQNKAHFQIGCAGHEAVQVAMAACLRPRHDWLYPYYRDMALVSAVGMTNRELLLNILNKADDPNSGGRQMPMHYGHKDLRIVTQSSPTGTQFLQAVGAACAIRYRGGDEIVYVSCGEGTTAQGAWHEALNWAARQKLPIVFLVQNNKFAISVRIEEQIAGASVASISSGYDGLEVVEVNGLDYEASFKVCRAAAERARSGAGPTVIVAEVVRLQSHSISDNQAKYRSDKELADDRAKDPIQLFSAKLIKQKLATQAELSSRIAAIQAEVDRDTDWAEQQSDPAPESVTQHVLKDAYPQTIAEPPPAAGDELFLVEALNRALDEEMERNAELVVFGQDVAGGKGGVFTVTSNLTKKYSLKRCFNSCLAEDSIIGSAIGMATLGMKPVAEIQFADFIWTAMMQMRDEMCMIHYRSNGSFSCPAVIRATVGGYIHGGLYHSQNIEGTFAHFPGIVVVLPSNAADAKGLLKSAIRANDPVLFLEHKGLYRQVYAKSAVGGKDDLIPLGKAKVVRQGTDATIVTWGAMVNRSLRAAAAIPGKSVEVIDLRTIMPLDRETIVSSVKKTGRLLVAQEDVLFMGLGAEIAALVMDEAFEYLDAPIKRVGGKFTPIPHAPILENAVLPRTADIEMALGELLSY